MLVYSRPAILSHTGTIELNQYYASFFFIRADLGFLCNSRKYRDNICITLVCRVSLIINTSLVLSSQEMLV